MDVSDGGEDGDPKIARPTTGVPAGQSRAPHSAGPWPGQGGPRERPLGPGPSAHRAVQVRLRAPCRLSARAPRQPRANFPAATLGGGGGSGCGGGGGGSGAGAEGGSCRRGSAPAPQFFRRTAATTATPSPLPAGLHARSPTSDLAVQTPTPPIPAGRRLSLPGWSRGWTARACESAPLLFPSTARCCVYLLEGPARHLLPPRYAVTRPSRAAGQAALRWRADQVSGPWLPRSPLQCRSPSNPSDPASHPSGLPPHPCLHRSFTAEGRVAKRGALLLPPLRPRVPPLDTPSSSKASIPAPLLGLVHVLTCHHPHTHSSPCSAPSDLRMTNSMDTLGPHFP